MPRANNIRVYSNRGRCCIKWKVSGQTYSITRGDYENDSHVNSLQATADHIMSDIHHRCFDESLLRYCPEKREKLIQDEKVKLKAATPSLETFKAFVEWKRAQLQYSSWKGYRALERRLEDFYSPGVFPKNLDELNTFLMLQEVSSKTKKNYATCFSAYGEWLVKKGASRNVFSGLKIKNEDKLPPKPFTKDEFESICSWFLTNSPFYYDFVVFKFLTGVRTGEAVGLQWRHINLENLEIAITESVTHAELGGKRRKGTKTNKSRIVPMSYRIECLLRVRLRETELKNKNNLDDLIFPNKWGNPIDSAHFSEKYWVPCLAALDIEYRPPYTTRHTFISHALAQGSNPMEIAKITGHDVSTLFKHYANVIKKPTLPELFNFED